MDNLEGLFDVQCNDLQFPKTIQPSHARWEEVAPSSQLLTNGDAHLTNGLTNGAKAQDHGEQPTADGIFQPLDPVYPRNFTIHDVYLESAPYSSIGLPGLDGATHDIGPSGLSGIDVEVADLLPPACRRAFDAAEERELEWKSRWLAEAADGKRASLLGTYLWTQ